MKNYNTKYNITQDLKFILGEDRVLGSTTYVYLVFSPRLHYLFSLFHKYERVEPTNSLCDRKHKLTNALIWITILIVVIFMISSHIFIPKYAEPFPRIL